MPQGQHSSRPQYGVPTDQQPFNMNGEATSYQTSEANVGLYASSQSALVLSGTGSPIYSNRSSPKPNVTSYGAGYSIDYCESKLPLSVNNPSTLVLSDDYHYRTALSNSNSHMVVSAQEGVIAYGDDLPNEAANSRNTNLDKLHTKILLSQQSFPADPLSNKDVYFNTPTANSRGAVSEFSDSSEFTSAMTPSGASSMVTGLGGGVGTGGGGVIPDMDFADDDLTDLLRVLGPDVMPYDSTDSAFPDLDLLKTFDNPQCQPNIASTPVDGDFINSFGDISVQPVQPVQQVENQPIIQNGISVPEQQSAGTIGDDLDLIKMMNVPVITPTEPSSQGLNGNSRMVVANRIPTSLAINVPPSPQTPSPPTPYSQRPPTPYTQDPAPSPLAPPTPMTPHTPAQTSQNGPFEIKSCVEKDKRICKVSIREDLPPQQRLVVMQANYFCWDISLKLMECLKRPCDLKVTLDARAELCPCTIDQQTAAIQCSLPGKCMLLDKWLQANQGKADLRDRQLVLQQVLNFMAALHTNGSQDKLSLWGSFVVWVAPDKKVYILVDFPEMLAKMEQHKEAFNFDPRSEDVKAIYEVYKKVFQPFINQDGSWVSPGVKQLLRTFEDLIRQPSSIYRMAELARILGERNLCKLEVELLTLPHFCYCIEQESLQSVLSYIPTLIPAGICQKWAVQWAESGAVVGSEVMASAHRHMRLVVAPVQYSPTAFMLASSPVDQGLTFSVLA